jgi:hypothetical protein
MSCNDHSKAGSGNMPLVEEFYADSVQVNNSKPSQDQEYRYLFEEERWQAGVMSWSRDRPVIVERLRQLAWP